MSEFADSSDKSSNSSVEFSSIIWSKVFILGVVGFESVVRFCNALDILFNKLSVLLIFWVLILCTKSCSFSLVRLLGWKWGADISFQNK